ncbi:hypothetical protein CQW23_15671 [Capsicum baccatum]|uniref:Ankyrin repeat-containing protein n=1 Tax=Capsicum baccatum TaxID=33114 RepID=A0A2G2WMP7_CAPBA|nr:hypothetical protein CQW23_15671 [Capsicum baccatum]
MKRQMSFGGGGRKRKFEGKGIKDWLCQQNQEGETALYVAAENENSLGVSEFLKHLDLKTASIMANNGYDTLHVAARQETGWHIPKVETFIICRPLGYIHVKRKSSASLWRKNEKMESLLGENGKRFCVSRAALSMMSTPKLGYLVEIIDECAVLICLNVVLGLSSVLTKIDDWSRSSLVVMEQCQETLSCMYLLQRFPLKFVGVDSNVLERILFTVLSILKSESFSRDCLVAAGVTFCVALQVCLNSKELGLFIMEGIFIKSFIVCPKFAFADVVKKISFKDNLIDELSKFSSLSRLCLVRLQVKTSMLNKNGSVDVNYDPISEDMGTRLLQIVWNNLEDPLSQTVKQVHLIFYLFLDI